MAALQRLHVLTPSYNDGDSLRELAAALGRLALDNGWQLDLVVVEDGSAEPTRFAVPPAGVQAVTSIELYANGGHQRAIAVGLAWLAEQGDADLVVVMDADGEDRPEDIPALLAAYRGGMSGAVVAHRARRREGWRFRASYQLFKLVHRALTGRRLAFGNFMLMDGRTLAALVRRPELWSHLPATLLRSRLPFVEVPTERGLRYAGRSRMNLVSLVLHGLGAISVFGDVALARVLIAAIGLSVLAVASILAVVAIRLFSDLAIPGWASNVTGALLIICLQSGLFVLSLIFLLLSGRGRQEVPPLLGHVGLVRSVATVRSERHEPLPGQ